jgi:asparagine synthase (glutamine-hydrolysing)
VPKQLVERPKTGFAIPIGSWLKGPLRPWAEELLSEKRLAAGGLLNPAPIRARWREHLEGRRNWHSPLWTVLMFQAWREPRRI